MKLKKSHLLQVPDGSRLSTEYLIKSSSIATVEQSSNLIAFIASGLDKAENQYAEVSCDCPKILDTFNICLSQTIYCLVFIILLSLCFKKLQTTTK